MGIYVRDLPNNMIKPFDNSGLESISDSVKHKVLIGDTTLRLFIPPQVCKMTSRLRQICGCEICIIPKNTHVDLNIFITKRVSDLQHKSIGRQTRNTSFITSSAAHYKDKLFLDGKCLHATIKYASQ